MGRKRANTDTDSVTRPAKVVMLHACDNFGTAERALIIICEFFSASDQRPRRVVDHPLAGGPMPHTPN
jgi:sortase (surface protein transpeptidase)